MRPSLQVLYEAAERLEAAARSARQAADNERRRLLEEDWAEYMASQPDIYGLDPPGFLCELPKPDPLGFDDYDPCQQSFDDYDPHEEYLSQLLRLDVE